MAGINFNDLPKNLQTKLQPFMTAAGTVENAIEAAKLNGSWTDADSKQLNSINGGANWGKVMDEYSFDSSKKAEYTQMAKNKKSKAKVYNLVESEEPKGYWGRVRAKMNSGYKKLGLASDKPGVSYSSAGRGLLYPIMGLAAMIVTGCETNLGLKNEQYADIVYVQNSKDYSDILQKILNAITGNNNDFRNFITDFKIAMNRQYESDKERDDALKSMFDRLMNVLEVIKANQGIIITDNELNFQKILDALNRIMKTNESAEDKLKSIMEILGHILSVTTSILDAINKAKDELKNTLNTNNNAVLAALEKLNKNDEQTLNVLSQIKNLINKFGNDGKSMAEAILVAIGKIDPSSKDYTAKLNEIIELLKKLDANNEARSKKVIDAISKLGVSVTGDLNAILNAIDSLPKPQDQKDYTEVLNAILDKINKGNAQNDANFKAVLAKIHEMGVSVSYGMNAILQALKDKPDYTVILNKILAKIEANKNEVSSNGRTLAQILAAMKDIQNNISIVMEGDRIKVSCNCGNCGGNKHEGIIGDLNQLLG